MQELNQQEIEAISGGTFDLLGGIAYVVLDMVGGVATGMSTLISDLIRGQLFQSGNQSGWRV